MEPWEDELLWDDDFSEEEEDTEEQIEETGLEMDADGFADWEDSSDTAPVDETLEEALVPAIHQVGDTRFELVTPSVSGKCATSAPTARSEC